MNLNYPYFLLIFIFLGFLWIYPKYRYYFTCSWTKPLPKKINILNIIKNSSFYIGWILLVLAATEPVIGKVTLVEKQPVRRYIFLNDASGSMVDTMEKNGIGKNLNILMKGNKAFLDLLEKRNNESIDKNLVGLVLFSNEAYISSYIIDDLDFLYKKISNINYIQLPLGQGTRVDLALWLGVNMFVSESFGKKENLNILEARMYKDGIDYLKDSKTEKFTSYLKNKLEGDSLILFTDGIFSSPRGSNNIMSIYKLINLCKDLGIRVYLLSVDQMDPKIESLCKETGGFSKPLNSFDERKFIDAYEYIIKTQPKDVIFKTEIVDEFLTIPLALSAFICLGLGFLLLGLIFINFGEV